MLNFIILVILMILFGYLHLYITTPSSITGAGGGMRAFRRPGTPNM